MSCSLQRRRVFLFTINLIIKTKFNKMKKNEKEVETPPVEWIIDADVVIELYNKKNPELRRLTQKSLAEKLGVTPQLLSDWKRGRIVGAVQVLKKMAKIGECPMDEILKEHKTPAE